MPREPHTPDDELFTPTEAAATLRSNTRTLERWRTTGTGPAFVKIGRKVAYTRASLGEFVAAQTRRHTGESGR